MATHMQQTYYDVLNVGSKASRQEIRESYVRLKQTFSTTNQALYSLMNDDEAAQMNAQVEEAFRILNDDHARRGYDRSIGLSTESEQPLTQRHQVRPEPILSTDPFSGTASASSVTVTLARTNIVSSTSSSQDTKPVSNSSSFAALVRNSQMKPARSTTSRSPETIEKMQAALVGIEPGDGSIFKMLREIAGVSEDEMQDRTKISIEYIRSIENNVFERLPRSIFVKGFLRSYCRYLAVPEYESLITAFAKRLDDWLISKERKISIISK